MWNANVGCCDLVFVDYTLPYGSSGDLAARFVGDKRAVIVFLMSGFVPELLPIPAATRNRVQFLQKPFNIARLQRKIADTLERP